MLTKRELGNGKVEVTFTMPGLEGVSRLYLVGDFNEWSIVSHPLTRAADGTWALTLPIDAGRTYQFRYFDNNGHWHNDWQADAYVPNQFGGDNSIVDARAEGSNVPAAAASQASAEPAQPKRRAPARKKAEAGAEAAPKKRAAPRKKKTDSA